MKVANRILLSVLTCFIFSLAGFSQTPPNLENGFKPFGSYDGTKFDTVNVMNGNLMVHIPLTDGQALAHLVQSIHNDASRRMRSGLARDARPIRAPYGQR